MFEKKKTVAALSAFAALAFLSAPVALADEIVLANGDRVSGKILRKESDKLVLTTPYAGDLNIKMMSRRCSCFPRLGCVFP